MIFNRQGVPKVEISNISNLSTIGNRIIVKNDTDGLYYTLGVQNIAGQAVMYLSNAGNVRIVNGVNQIRNDTDGLWYPLIAQTIAGQVVLYLGAGVP